MANLLDNVENSVWHAFDYLALEGDGTATKLKLKVRQFYQMTLPPHFEGVPIVPFFKGQTFERHFALEKVFKYCVTFGVNVYCTQFCLFRFACWASCFETFPEKIMAGSSR